MGGGGCVCLPISGQISMIFNVKFLSLEGLAGNFGISVINENSWIRPVVRKEIEFGRGKPDTPQDSGLNKYPDILKDYELPNLSKCIFLIMIYPKQL